ncbi:MAG: hypothetical protein CL933_09020 [Deltaproteobacteria bacterium]|nr:hypothetical protein [Deltaproteobacteria bacterium]
MISEFFLGVVFAPGGDGAFVAPPFVEYFPERDRDVFGSRAGREDGKVESGTPIDAQRLPFSPSVSLPG